MDQPNEKLETLNECGNASKQELPMINTVDDTKLKQQAECSVLEEEFVHLHGGLGAEFPHNKSADEREQELRKRVHALKDDDRRTALCLSGGGIRSATFSLGVLQGLAQKGLLDKFHYLSTVSGGGYIGSWLSSWIHHSSLQSVQQELSAPQKGASAEPKPARRLQAYSNYLSPVWGLSIDFLTLIATFLRNLILNWFVLIPLLAAVLILPRLYLGALDWNPAGEHYMFSFLVVVASLLATGIAYISADLPSSAAAKNTPVNKYFTYCFLPILSAGVLLSWIGIRYADILQSWHLGRFLVGGALVHLAGVGAGQVWRRARGLPLRNMKDDVPGMVFVLLSGAAGGGLLYLVQYLSKDVKATLAFRELYAALAVPVLLVSFWLGTTIYAGLARCITSDDDREWWARSGAWLLGASIAWIFVFVLVIYGPRWVLDIPWFSHPAGPATLGVGGGILGIITGMIGYWSKNGAMLKERAKGIAAATGLRLLDLAAIAFTIILLLAVSYGISWGLYGTAKFIDSHKQWIEKWDVSRETNMVKELDKQRTDASELQAQPKSTVTPEEAARATESAAKVSEVSTALMQPPKPGQSLASWTYVFVLQSATLRIISILFVTLLAIGITMSIAIGTNTFSMHSMYGNRLVRAYLGATRKERHPHWFTGFDPEDNVSMKDLNASVDGLNNSKKNRLFHVVNMALNMVQPSGGHLEWQQRKAASFTVSPLYSGSSSVGYRPTESYSSKEGGVSLGRAMAISGAAASPNMGYNTSTMVAFVMTFFNIRLGWWLPNPGPKWRSVWSRSEPRFGIKALMAEALARTTDDTPYVYLSDGGHFENLALYEMVKRRCHRIVLVDAGCDPKYTFEDLENAIRKIRTDMGISIVFPEGLPTPQNASESNRHIAIGTICYSSVDGKVENGSIIYIKPVMSGDEPLDVKRYRAANNKPSSPFPHQSTADQFFDEAQFESYRMLGYHSVLTGFPGNGTWPKDGQNSDTEIDDEPEPVSPVPQKVASSDGMFGGLSDAIQSMSQGALIATAITVGGIVGVTGTVALKDATVALAPGAELKLRDADAELLKKGLAITLSSDLEQHLNTQTDKLVSAVDKLFSALDKAPQTVQNDSEFASKIKELAGAVNSLVNALPLEKHIVELKTRLSILENSKLVSKPTLSALGDIKTVLDQVRDALGDMNDKPKPGSVRHKLDDVNINLEKLIKKADLQGNTSPSRGGVR